jgi:hypothetical protein
MDQKTLEGVIREWRSKKRLDIALLARTLNTIQARQALPPEIVAERDAMVELLRSPRNISSGPGALIPIGPKRVGAISGNERLALHGIMMSEHRDIEGWASSRSCNFFERKRFFAGAVVSLLRKGLIESSHGRSSAARLRLTAAGIMALAEETAR